jgi:hypothetical protein
MKSEVAIFQCCLHFTGGGGDIVFSLLYLCFKFCTSCHIFNSVTIKHIIIYAVCVISNPHDCNIIQGFSGM